MQSLIPLDQPGYLTQPTLPDCVVAGTNAGIFPGAYKNMMLLNASVNANTFNPLTEEDCYSALAKLQEAFKSRFGPEYKSMPMAAMRVMALEADGDKKIKILEEVLINIHESNFQIVREFLANQQTINNLTYTQASKLLIQNALDSTDVKETHQTSGIQNKGLKDSFIASSGTALASVDILETAVTLLVKANVLESCWSNPAIDRETLRRLNQELINQFQQFTKFCDNQLESAGLMQISKLRLQQLSPRVRTIDLIDGINLLNWSNTDLLKRMHTAYRQEPFCGPLVIITAANGRLFYNEGEKKYEIIPTVADDLMCRDASFLAITRDGRISFAHMYYDYGWGRLSTQNAIDLNREFGNGFLPKEGAYDWKQLCTILNLFPSLNFERINGELANLKLDPEFEAYLADKSLRYGPRMLKNKSWLDPLGKAQNTEMTDFLASIYLRLIDSNRLQENGTQHKAMPETVVSNDSALKIDRNLEFNKKQYLWLSKMLANSYMTNTQGENFLIDFLQKATESRHTLRNFRLENYADMKASDWLKSLEKSEDLLAVGLLFDLKENNTQGVRLTEFGAAYLLSLLSPDYKYHHTGDDCIELQEARARRDLDRRF